jgi:hypothetical protein
VRLVVVEVNVSLAREASHRFHPEAAAKPEPLDKWVLLDNGAIQWDRLADIFAVLVEGISRRVAEAEAMVAVHAKPRDDGPRRPRAVHQAGNRALAAAAVDFHGDRRGIKEDVDQAELGIFLEIVFLVEHAVDFALTVRACIADYREISFCQRHFEGKLAKIRHFAGRERKRDGTAEGRNIVTIEYGRTEEGVPRSHPTIFRSSAQKSPSIEKQSKLRSDRSSTAVKIERDRSALSLSFGLPQIERQRLRTIGDRFKFLSQARRWRYSAIEQRIRRVRMDLVTRKYFESDRPIFPTGHPMDDEEYIALSPGF